MLAKLKKTSTGGDYTVIGAGTNIVGNVTTSENLQVYGRIEGDVSCVSLEQGESGAILGNIVAGQVHIAGLVDGTVTADFVTLQASARVTGDVVYETLSIEAGANVEGRVGQRKEGIVAKGQKSAIGQLQITESYTKEGEFFLAGPDSAANAA